MRFLRSAKAADARPETGNEPANSSRGAVETAAVLRGFLKSRAAKRCLARESQETARPLRSALPGGFLNSCCLISMASVSLVAQALNPGELLTAPTSTWPTYNGDYSGRRFSPLSQINAANVHSLALQWIYRTRDSGPRLIALGTSPTWGHLDQVAGINM